MSVAANQCNYLLKMTDLPRDAQRAGAAHPVGSGRQRRLSLT